jgi:NADPH-dependent 2,4-dienoyl-CoA reductase/sulfur reductase-like enzyme/ferredoxin
LSQPLTVGRDCPGEVLADDGVSREHLRLVPSPTALSAVDLGSRNGTTVNGTALSGRAVLAPGDVLRLGRSEIIVLHTSTAAHNGHEPDHDSTRLGMRAVAVPPPPPVAAERSRLLALAERVLGIDPTGERDVFRAYHELPTKVPLGVWRGIRVGSIAVYLTVIALLFVRPATGLFVMFHVIVPLLPILFFVAPGLWRNICPMAASNQMPRVLGIGGGRAVPDWLRNRGYLIAVAGFFGIAGARLAGLDRSGPAMGIVLVAVVAIAVTGGFVFKGKSGWCSSICPLLPLQRVYGQTPFVTVPNSHCTSCVGCAKNCYDFKPRAAWQADMADPDKGWSGPRKLFAAALPGFVLGFFVLRTHANIAVTQQYALLALVVFVSIGSFFALDAMSPLSPSMLTVGYGAVAINAFYWFSGPLLADAVNAGWLRWPISAAVAVLTLLWIARTRVSELQFALTTGARTEPVLLGIPKRRSASEAEAGVQVRFDGGEPVAADVGMSVLDVAEKGGQPIEAGCRMGVCGADPVAILDGMSCLSAPEGDELNTLRRLGLGKSTRMACCARIKAGSVSVSLTPEPGDGGGAKPTRYDRSVVSVVVLGNGIAGVTAADFIRRGHPDCEIHVVGRESHALYNRMGISRLVHGRSAMQGLYLLPEQWYDEHGVTAWLNTVAMRIDLRWRRVQLGTGEALPFDRLILAMGSSAAMPPIDGLNRPGVFALREAGDAMQLRAYAQQHGCRRAVVAGGGLLGLEAAYSLHLLGLHVTVLERGTRLLSKQIDPRCSELVEAHFERVGIEILRRAETSHVVGAPAVTGAVLKDGRTVPCEVFLAATGIRPNIDLAREAGIPVNKGVLVDDRMQTRVPGVFAAGDVAEHGGHVRGLWPVATEQAQAAAVNALGGNMVLASETPPTILKGVDLELFSVGAVEPSPTDDVIVIDRPGVPSYRRLVLSGGRAVGATVLGHHPTDLTAAQKAVRDKVAVGAAERAQLTAGNWSVLADLTS